MKLLSILKTITNAGLIALIVVPLGHPFPEGQPALRFSEHTQKSATPCYFSVVGDFDGDHRVDHAEPHSAGAHHCIRVRFGNSFETHLEFGSYAHSSGALIVRDTNRDNHADLIWVSHSRLGPAVVWLGDGLGHFARAAELKDDDDLRGIV